MFIGLVLGVVELVEGVEVEVETLPLALLELGFVLTLLLVGVAVTLDLLDVEVESTLEVVVGLDVVIFELNCLFIPLINSLT